MKKPADYLPKHVDSIATGSPGVDHPALKHAERAREIALGYNLKSTAMHEITRALEQVDIEARIEEHNLAPIWFPNNIMAEERINSLQERLSELQK